MANPILILNQQYVSEGLGSFGYTVAKTGNFNATVQVTVPNAIAVGDGAGSNTGLGAGTGGGGEGFTGGDLGLTHGGVGQGFGTGNGYQQPPAAGSNQTNASNISSSLVIVVKKNGSTIYTAPTMAAFQESAKFKFPFQATAADVMLITLSSAGSDGNILNSLKSQIQIGEGF